MLDVHSIEGSEFIVRIVGEPPILSTSLEKEIDNLWLAEESRRGKTIFNGRIMSATNISSNGIDGCIVEYRHLIAQRAQPDLFDVLRIRPVAVSGFLECADGIILGRRSNATTQDAGLWELVPSGGIDGKNLKPPVKIEFLSQLLQELHEELGLPVDVCSNFSCIPFCVVEDPLTHVIDIGIFLQTALSFDAIYSKYKSIGSKEYSELRVFSYIEFEKFIKNNADSVVEVSKVLFKRWERDDG